jgi:hypothetical protein
MEKCERKRMLKRFWKFLVEKCDRKRLLKKCSGKTRQKKFVENISEKFLVKKCDRKVCCHDFGNFFA